MRAFTVSCVAPGAPSNEALLSRWASAPPLAPQRVLRLLRFSEGKQLFFRLLRDAYKRIVLDGMDLRTKIGPNFCSTRCLFWMPAAFFGCLQPLDGISFFLGNDELAQGGWTQAEEAAAPPRVAR